jgi:hypothetical protein
MIQGRFRLKRQMPVHTAQRRKTGWVLSLFPMLLVGALYGGLYFVNPEMMSLLWKNPMGIKILWIVFGLQVVSGLIIRETVRAEEAVFKTTIKLLFPFVLFILSQFLVALGPAMISMMESYKNLNH